MRQSARAGVSRGFTVLTVSILLHRNAHDPLVEFNVAIVFREMKHFTVHRLELHAPVFRVGVHGNVSVQVCASGWEMGLRVRGCVGVHVDGLVRGCVTGGGLVVGHIGEF